MGVKYALDTSAYSAWNRGDTRLKRFLGDGHQIVVTLIVIGELRAGFALGSRQALNDRLLGQFLDAPNVSVAGLADETANIYADLFSRQRAAGQPVGANDLWIAAVAIERDLPLLTLDGDFGRIAGLKLVKI